MKKIVYFIEVLGWGGIETFISNVLKKIDLEKYSIEIVCINKISNHFDVIFDDLKVNVVVLKKERIANPVKRYFIGVNLFKKYLKDNKCNIVHFHISNAIDFLHVQAAKEMGVTYRIAHSHNSDVNKSYKRIGHEVLKLMLKKCPTHRIGCSLKAYNWLFDNYKDGKPMILRNGVDVSKFAFNETKRNEIRYNLGLQDKYIVLHIGRFNIQKNHEFMIDFFYDYLSRNPNAVLLLVGAGELKERMIEKVKNLRCEDNIMFCGEIEDIPGYLMASDVFILPSLYEGLPVVGIEAQASGIACILSDTITSEVKINSNVEFCDIKNRDVWLDKLDGYSKTINRESSKKVIDAGYDIETTVKEIEEMYDSLKN